MVQVSVSQGGIPKRAIPSAEVTPAGIAGDRWRHPWIHGGPRKALLIMTAEGIEDLVSQGFPLYPGALGENITTRGLDRLALRAGQRYRLGEAIIKLTEIRAPCRTLNVHGAGIQAALCDAQVRAGNPASPRWGLSGFYASVIRAGAIRLGDSISLVGEFTR